jgi:hypothetical protein
MPLYDLPEKIKGKKGDRHQKIAYFHLSKGRNQLRKLDLPDQNVQNDYRQKEL